MFSIDQSQICFLNRGDVLLLSYRRGNDADGFDEGVKLKSLSFLFALTMLASTSAHASAFDGRAAGFSSPGYTGGGTQYAGGYGGSVAPPYTRFDVRSWFGTMGGPRTDGTTNTGSGGAGGHFGTMRVLVLTNNYNTGGYNNQNYVSGCYSCTSVAY